MIAIIVMIIIPNAMKPNTPAISFTYLSNGSSSSITLLYHKKIAPGGAKSDDFDKYTKPLSIIIVPHFNFFVNKKPPEGGFLRFTWTITLRNVISSIRRGAGFSPYFATVLHGATGGPPRCLSILRISPTFLLYHKL